MLERMKHRELMRQQLLQQQENSPDKNAALAATAASQKALITEKIETRNKIDIFENAFRKIKEATGVSDVNEVIQKIVSQESTTENLISLTRENQGKIEALNELRRKVKLAVEEVKYSGVGGGHRRKTVDDHEDQLATAGARLERCKIRYERLSKLVTAMKAGIGHLQDKLEAVRDEVGGKRHDLGDETVAEILRECELCLNNVIRRIRAGDDDRKRAEMTGGVGGAKASGTKSAADDHSISTAAALDDSNMATTRPYNQRINLSLDDEEEGFFVEDSGMPDLDDEELTRDRVKRASTLILQAVDRRQRKVAAKKSSPGVM